MENILADMRLKRLRDIYQDNNSEKMEAVEEEHMQRRLHEVMFRLLPAEVLCLRFIVAKESLGDLHLRDESYLCRRLFEYGLLKEDCLGPRQPRGLEALTALGRHLHDVLSERGT